MRVSKIKKTEKRYSNNRLLISSSLVLLSFLSGCASSEKTLYPPEQPTIQEAQYDYEHISKPIVYEEPTTQEQYKEFKSYLASSFKEIDSYKDKFATKKRYGKDIINAKNKKTTQNPYKQNTQLDYLE